MSCTFSFVLCSRNDNYHGNPVWRLQTSLNYLAQSYTEFCQRSCSPFQVEVIVADWGSKIPLRTTLVLTEEASEIVRFVEIPECMAKEQQKDSPFAEVLALNTAIRRSTGEYIGRIDQDTLVTRFFFDTLAKMIQSNKKSISQTFFFAERCGIPYVFSSRTPRFAIVSCFVRYFGCFLPFDGPQIWPWFDRPVGIVFMHRDLWWELRGYDEHLIYWGWMETDLAYRIQMKYSVVRLRRKMKKSFFHLEHIKLRLPKIPRQKNPRGVSKIFIPNSDSWGNLTAQNLTVKNYDIVSKPYSKQQNFSYIQDIYLMLIGILGIIPMIVFSLLLRIYGVVNQLRKNSQEGKNFD